MTSSPNPDLSPPDAATDHILGPTTATPPGTVSLIEYGDFECPYCAQAYPAVKIILERFGSRLQFVYRHFPQREIHPRAEAAAEAAEAAGAQGQFWAYHDLLYTHHRHLDPEHLQAHARLLGLDMARFQSEIDDTVYRQRVQEHLASGQSAGVRATPTFFVNGRVVDVSFGTQHLEDAIAAALGES